MSVRTLRIEKTTSKEPFDFEQWVEKGGYVVASLVLSMGRCLALTMLSVHLDFGKEKVILMIL